MKKEIIYISSIFCENKYMVLVISKKGIMINCSEYDTLIESENFMKQGVKNKINNLFTNYTIEYVDINSNEINESIKLFDNIQTLANSRLKLLYFYFKNSVKRFFLLTFHVLKIIFFK